MEEALGFAFGGCVVTVSLWLLYQWSIKPNRDRRRQNSRRSIEKMHREHWERLRRRHLQSKHLCSLCLVSWWVLLTPTSVEAQRRSVTLTGAVNETVALSIAPNSSHSDIDVDAVTTDSTVRITLAGIGIKSPAIRVRLLVRSNIGFNISGMLESKTVLRTQLSVIDVRATGKLVLPEAIDSLEIPQRFDMRGQKDNDSSKAISTLDVAQPFLLLSGPRVSVGGTLESPNNALQITVLIRITPQSTGDWQVHLTFVSKKQAVEM